MASLWSQGHCVQDGGQQFTVTSLEGHCSPGSVSILHALSSLPPDDPVMAGGVAFTVSLVSTTPDLVSEISFVVNSVINGMVLVCSGVDASGVVARSVTLQENAAGKQMKATMQCIQAWKRNIHTMYDQGHRTWCS